MRAATYGKGYENLERAMRERITFTTGGAMCGERWTRYTVLGCDLGRLPSDASNQFMLDHLAGIDFVVWSYGTPIAWVRKDGDIIIPNVKYSVTTSRHQGLCYLLKMGN